MKDDELIVNNHSPEVTAANVTAVLLQPWDPAPSFSILNLSGLLQLTQLENSRAQIWT